MAEITRLTSRTVEFLKSSTIAPQFKDMRDDILRHNVQGGFPIQVTHRLDAAVTSGNMHTCGEVWRAHMVASARSVTGPYTSAVTSVYPPSSYQAPRASGGTSAYTGIPGPSISVRAGPVINNTIVSATFSQKIGKIATESMKSVKDACSLKNIPWTVGVLVLIGTFAYACTLFPYTRFFNAMWVVFATPNMIPGRDGGVAVNWDDVGFQNALGKVPVIANTVTRLLQAEKLLTTLTGWQVGVNRWMVGAHGDGGMVKHVDDMNRTCKNMVLVFRYHGRRLSARSSVSNRSIASLMMSNWKNQICKRQHVTMGTQVADSFLNAMSHDVQAEMIRDLQDKLQRYENASRADAEAQAAERLHREAKEKTDAEARAAERLEREARDKNESDALRVALQNDFDRRFEAFQLDLRRDQRSWHTEIVAGIVIGGLGATVVVLVSNPAVLVVVANGGGWGSAFAGAVKSVLTFFGVQSVVQAAAVAEVALAATAEAAAVVAAVGAAGVV